MKAHDFWWWQFQWARRLWEWPSRDAHGNWRRRLSKWYTKAHRPSHGWLSLCLSSNLIITSIERRCKRKLASLHTSLNLTGRDSGAIFASDDSLPGVIMKLKCSPHMWKEQILRKARPAISPTFFLSSLCFCCCLLERAQLSDPAGWVPISKSQANAVKLK